MITVSAGTVIRGDLITTAHVELAGQVDGRIVCSRLDILSDGYVNGSIAARALTVAGQVVGQIEARSVTLEDGAFVEGDVHYVSIVLEHGATLTGETLRLEAGFTPPELAALEADLKAADAQLDDLEQQSRQQLAERAAEAYPAYEEARRVLSASR